MTQRTKSKEEVLSRDEATLVCNWLADTLHSPPPKGGRMHFLHRKPSDIAKEYKLTTEAIVEAARRKVVETA